MPELPRPSYSEARGWDDERLRSANESMGTRVNRVELDVLLAIKDGHCRPAEVVEATGLSAGQVEHAGGVLQAQGLAEWHPDA